MSVNAPTPERRVTAEEAWGIRHGLTLPARARELPAVDVSSDGRVETPEGVRLELREITVSFDGLTVLDHLTLTLARGEMRFLIGPNGAGKTTLLDVITGKTQPRGGTVLFEGYDLAGWQEHDIAQRGIGRKFQTPTVFPSLTARQNMEIAVGAKAGFLAAMKRMAAPDRELVGETLQLIGLEGRASQQAGQLSHGEKQWLEIGMLIVQEPKVLLLDEPVAGMTRGERDRTVALLGRMQAAHPDRTTLIVEHDMAFVRQLAKTVTVLHLGSVLSEGTMEEVQSDPRVIEVYLGHGKKKVA
ncbi:MAG: urea ABC transporter ATP-binding protein UrtD [Chloroflexi bacterium]|nr:urea ABC transporter ATP-binding protein UrtD [Chloroflexota bacterium]